VQGAVTLLGLEDGGGGVYTPSWTPISYNPADVTWNWAKFLVGKDGVPFKRYSPQFFPIEMEADIQQLINA